MTELPGRLPHQTAGQRYPDPTYDGLEKVLREAAAEAVKDLPPTSYRDESETPVTGNSPAVPQPGRTPMSQKATDDSVRMLCFGGMTLLVCGGVSVLLVASDYADPNVIGLFFGGLALVAFAVSRALKRLGQAAPREIHNHNNGPVYQSNTEINNKNSWWGKSSTES